MPRVTRSTLGARLAKRRRKFARAMTQLRADEADAAAAQFLPPLPTCPVTMHTPCAHCAEPRGYIARVGTSAVMRCAGCRRFQYNAAKPEQIRHWGTVA